MAVSARLLPAPAPPFSDSAPFARGTLERALGEWLRQDARALGTLLPALAHTLGRLGRAHPACAVPALVEAAVTDLLGADGMPEAEQRLRALGAHVARRLGAAHAAGAAYARLERLVAFDARAARLAECVYLAGMEPAAAAAVLGLAPDDAGRRWNYARAWLLAAPPAPLTQMRFAHLRALFDAAPDAPPDRTPSGLRETRERATAYAARACGPDGALRAQLGALLDARRAPLPAPVLCLPAASSHDNGGADCIGAGPLPRHVPEGDGATRLAPIVRAQRAAAALPPGAR